MFFSNSRPRMTREAFEEARTFCDNNWWSTGDGLLYGAQMMKIKRWNSWGSRGNKRLTEPQRVLMAWGDLVGQVSNGGVSQFCGNYSASMNVIWPLIKRLQWPDLIDRLGPALSEQLGDPMRPRRPPPSVLDEPGKWRQAREKVVEIKAEEAIGEKPTKEFIQTMSGIWGDHLIAQHYLDLVSSGKMEHHGERYFQYEWPPEDVAQAFDDWFCTDQTKAESRKIIPAFIAEREGKLVIIE